ncbi:hypothetical protein D3C74_471510 [compost metagenome]
MAYLLLVTPFIRTTILKPEYSRCRLGLNFFCDSLGLDHNSNELSCILIKNLICLTGYLVILVPNCTFEQRILDLDVSNLLSLF